MAQGLARHLFGDAIEAESAGVDAWCEAVEDHAREVVLELTGGAIDLAGHVSRDLDDVDPACFDQIVVLHPDVARSLEEAHPQLTRRPLVWKIKDPYERGLARYWEVAREVLEQLSRAKRTLLGEWGGSAGATSKSISPPTPVDPEPVQALRRHLARWRHEIQEGRAEGTGASGILSKAVDRYFVHALRLGLAQWMALNGIDRDVVRRAVGSAKDLETCAFGDVVGWLKASRAQSDALATAFSEAALVALDPMPHLRNRLAKPQDLRDPPSADLLDIMQRVEQVLDLAPEFFARAR